MEIVNYEQFDALDINSKREIIKKLVDRTIPGERAERMKRILELRMKGMSYTEIGRRFTPMITGEAVRQKIRKYESMGQGTF